MGFIVIMVPVAPNYTTIAVNFVIKTGTKVKHRVAALCLQDVVAAVLPFHIMWFFASNRLYQSPMND